MISDAYDRAHKSRDLAVYEAEIKGLLPIVEDLFTHENRLMRFRINDEKEEAKMRRAVDAEVDRLNSLPRNKEFRRITAELDSIKEKVDLARSFLDHCFWEVHDLQAIGVEEPPSGCGECYRSGYLDRYNQLMEELVGVLKGNYETKNPSKDSKKMLIGDLYKEIRHPAKMGGWREGDAIQ